MTTTMMTRKIIDDRMTELKKILIMWMGLMRHDSTNPLGSGRANPWCSQDPIGHRCTSSRHQNPPENPLRLVVEVRPGFARCNRLRTDWSVLPQDAATDMELGAHHRTNQRVPSGAWSQTFSSSPLLSFPPLVSLSYYGLTFKSQLQH